jgi:hypothetical protein
MILFGVNNLSQEVKETIGTWVAVLIRHSSLMIWSPISCTPKPKTQTHQNQ